jgi:hypothetical protein
VPTTSARASHLCLNQQQVRENAQLALREPGTTIIQIKNAYPSETPTPIPPPSVETPTFSFNIQEIVLYGFCRTNNSRGMLTVVRVLSTLWYSHSKPDSRNKKHECTYRTYARCFQTMANACDHPVPSPPTQRQSPCAEPTEQVVSFQDVRNAKDPDSTAFWPHPKIALPPTPAAASALALLLQSPRQPTRQSPGRFQALIWIRPSPPRKPSNALLASLRQISRPGATSARLKQIEYSEQAEQPMETLRVRKAGTLKGAISGS